MRPPTLPLTAWTLQNLLQDLSGFRLPHFTPVLNFLDFPELPVTGTRPTSLRPSYSYLFTILTNSPFHKKYTTFAFKKASSVEIISYYLSYHNNFFIVTVIYLWLMKFCLLSPFSVYLCKRLLK
jgi:hypothetical protein